VELLGVYIELEMTNYIQNEDEDELLLLRSERKRRRTKEEAVEKRHECNR